MQPSSNNKHRNRKIFLYTIATVFLVGVLMNAYIENLTGEAKKIPLTDEYSCTDYDAGSANPHFEASYVEMIGDFGNAREYYDTCRNANTLVEYYCGSNNRLEKENVNCLSTYETECQNGACSEPAAQNPLNFENLMIYYDFNDEGSIIDQSGNNNNPEIMGNPIWTTDSPSENANDLSLELNGIDDYIEHDHGSAFIPEGSSYTVMGWYKTTDFENNYFLVWATDGYRVDSYAGLGTSMEWHPNEIMSRAQLTGPGDWPKLNSFLPTSYNNNNWNHYALVFHEATPTSSAYMKIYINGELADTITATDPTYNSRNIDIFGVGVTSTDEPYNGSVDDVYVFKRILEEEEIDAYYNWVLDIPPGCGDGLMNQPEEECDDGNIYNEDGCSSTCTIEEGWTCEGEPSNCNEICGDNMIVGNELCDGTELNGQTCESQGYEPGTLACYAAGTPDECTFDTTNCGPTVTGVYYVDTNSIGGACSNSNEGTISEPWCTISYAVSANSPVEQGDTIYVREGTYFESVSLGKSGTANNHITLSNFADEEVVLEGANTVTDWELVSGDTYRTQYASYPVGVFVDNNLIEEEWPFPETVTIEDYLLSGQWSYGNGYLYINLGENPNTHTIDVPARANGININCNKFWDINGFVIQRYKEKGIYLPSLECSETCEEDMITITNNVISYNEIAGIINYWCPSITIDSNTIEKSGLRRSEYGMYQNLGLRPSQGEVWQQIPGTNVYVTNKSGYESGPEFLYYDGVFLPYDYSTEPLGLADPESLPENMWSRGDHENGSFRSDILYVHLPQTAPMGQDPSNYHVKRGVERAGGAGILFNTESRDGKFRILNNVIKNMSSKGVSFCYSFNCDEADTIGSVFYNNDIINSGESGFDVDYKGITFAYNNLWMNGVRDMEGPPDNGGDKGLKIGANLSGWRIHHNVIQGSGNHDASFGSANSRIFHNTLVKDTAPLDQPLCSNWGGFSAMLRGVGDEEYVDLAYKNNIFMVSGEGIHTVCNARGTLDCYNEGGIDCENEVEWNGNDYFTEETDKRYTFKFSENQSCLTPDQNPTTFCSLANNNIMQRYENDHRTDGVFDSYAVNPMFVDQANNNLELQAESELIDVGVPLTWTVGSGTNVNVVNVVDALYFHDSGDYAELPVLEKVVVNNSIEGPQPCTIIDVDYTANWIECEEIITYSDNDKVYWNYNGEKPDIGAFETS